MSWWVSLNDKPEAGDQEVKPLEVESFQDGGTYVMDGSDEADLNITYNYGGHFREHLDKVEGIKWLDGKQAKDTVDALKAAVAALGTEGGEDYWAATPGNAGIALARLLSWAEQHPNGYWAVD